MGYLAIMNWDGNNRITKVSAEFATLAEAQAVAAQGGTLPGTNIAAYAVQHPGGNIKDLVCDPVAKTVTVTVDLPASKKETFVALDNIAKTKIRLGWVYNTKTYQCDDVPLPQGGSYLSNMNRYLNAYVYFTVTKPAWATLTVYSLGDIVIQAKVFYKCVEAHTAGVFATDLAAAKWAVWYFHPFKGGNGKWRDKDNGMNSLTTEQTKDMCEGAVNYHMAVLAQAVVHKDAIMACATEADRLTYKTNTMPTGWPANT